MLFFLIYFERYLNGNIQLSNFIKKSFNPSFKTKYLTSNYDECDLAKLKVAKYSSIINLKKVNDIRYINKFFENINEALPDSGLILSSVVTYPTRRVSIFKKYPPILNELIYFIDFIFSRVTPKLLLLRKFIFF